MKKTLILSAAALCWGVALSAPTTQNRNAFLQQQAYAEVNRISGQVDALQRNYEDLDRRLSALERGGSENAAMRSEINSLRSQISDLKRQLEAQRGEIVNDLSGKMVKMQQQQAAAAAAQEKKREREAVVAGPHLEYTVQPGDTLSLIAKAFNTSVAKIRQMNPKVNPNNLKVGMKINVPKE